MRSSALRWAGIALAVTVLAGCSAPVPAAPDPDPATPAEATVPSQQPVSGEGPDQPSSPGAAEGDSGSPGQSGTPESGAPDAPQGPADSGSEQDPGSEQSPPSSPPSTSDPDAVDDDEPGSSPPAAEGPAIVITAMSCNGSGDYQTLRVQLTASYSTTYRKGISWVRLTREDNRGTSWIPQTDADWAGQYAGKGDRWSGELPSRTPSKDNYGYGQDYGKTLKLRVRTDDGTIWEQLHPIERNC